jgi:hypothetical protein
VGLEKPIYIIFIFTKISPSNIFMNKFLFELSLSLYLAIYISLFPASLSILSWSHSSMIGRFCNEVQRSSAIYRTWAPAKYLGCTIARSYVNELTCYLLATCHAAVCFSLPRRHAWADSTLAMHACTCPVWKPCRLSPTKTSQLHLISWLIRCM